MKYEKWRELKIDPLKVDFKKIKIKEIVNYPPAGNDVIECKVIINNETLNVFIKFQRSKMAKFVIEAKHLNILKNDQLYEKIPNVYEGGKVNETEYIVLEKMNGARMSDIFAQDASNKQKYLFKYGAELAKIHQISFEKFNKAFIRPINDIPQKKDYEFDDFIKFYIDYLEKNKSNNNQKTFIHGDFHYANLLWENGELIGVLDWEYSGVGNKEQDIAWACILRSTQKFMSDFSEIETFLRGYNSVGEFNKKDLKWRLINGYCHFYLMNRNNNEYCQKLQKLLEEAYNNLFDF